MAAAGKWQIYNGAKKYMSDGTFDMDAVNRFRCVLVTSSYTPALTHDAWSSVSANEVATAYGYTANGVVCVDTWTESSGTITWDVTTDPSWTASGGSITARYAVIVQDANTDGTIASTDKLLAYCLLDSTPADVTATTGNAFTIVIDAAGVFTVSGGTGA
jgi:hypothetical protein